MNKENRRLRALSVTDGLTGLYNKRFFSKQIDVEINRTRRTGEAFSLIFIDLDNFKAVNDTHGHAAGDAFLVRVSAGLCSKIRPTDFACRIGGDEFAVILPTTTLRDAVRIAGRWLELIEKTASETGLPVSASIGVDQYEAACAADGAAFLHGVDQLLYRAKKEGKGKIVHPDLMPEDAASVTREEREVLYHIFRPASSGKRKQSKTG
ncbi:MAG TPA: GGDEF domain-containing protein [Smithellaceae bacterium]|nr:GGDEF domain-containing protein [Smithellaceae bacterium]